jgi:hypothetical protein
MSENIHDQARSFLSVAPGLKLTDAQKRAVFEFADWIYGNISTYAQPAPAPVPDGEPGQIITAAEWMQLSAETRAAINYYCFNAEKLAGLVLEPQGPGSIGVFYPPSLAVEMRRLAGAILAGGGE